MERGSSVREEWKNEEKEGAEPGDGERLLVQRSRRNERRQRDDQQGGGGGGGGVERELLNLRQISNNQVKRGKNKGKSVKVCGR